MIRNTKQAKMTPAPNTTTPPPTGAQANAKSHFTLYKVSSWSSYLKKRPTAPTIRSTKAPNITPAPKTTTKPPTDAQANAKSHFALYKVSSRSSYLKNRAIVPMIRNTKRAKITLAPISASFLTVMAMLLAIML